MREGDFAVPALAGHAASLLGQLAGAERELIQAAVTQLLTVLEGGGTCLSLSELGEPADVATRLAALSVVGQPGEECPLILDGLRLYLQRYHYYEARLAVQLLRLAETSAFVPSNAKGDAARLLSHALCVITGGPGTGKTTMAASLLELLSNGASGALSVALMAPTGKAAARLLESIRTVTEHCPNLQVAHGTVHRLLGSRPGSVFFRHNASRPLPYDVVVLDEASMMDLPLMAKLLDAVDAERTRFVMLGDPGQLPSIYSGCALGDIVEAAQNDAQGRMAACFLRLTVNHRSGEQPDLAALIDAVRVGDAERSMTLFRRSNCLELLRPPLPDQMAEFVRCELSGYLESLSGAYTPEMALEAAARYRLVCMLRMGPCGADAVNLLGMELARHMGLCGRAARFFHGMPLIVTRNEHQQNLFNGDSGVVLEAEGRLCAFFPGANGPRAVSLQSLPPFEPAFALTVHRGQGSEYRDLTILLPSMDHPMLSRELFYTAVSRAQNSVRVMGTELLLRRALSRTVQRASGLADRLKGK